MTRIVAIPLGYILELLYNFLGNYGLTIILFTVIIRLIIFPLYAAQMKSSRQMMKIQPKIKEIQTAYAGNPEKMNEKMQEIYSENKIHPAMGCLPLLIQLPVIWGLFGLLRSPLKYLGDNDTMVLAVHESFGWVNDLCQPDQWYILPVIAGLATYISMKFTTAMTPQAPGGAGASMKAMQYFMPVMIAWMATTLPAGVSLYWIISYIFQIFQITISRHSEKKREEKEAIRQRESKKLKQTHKKKKTTAV